MSRASEVGAILAAAAASVLLSIAVDPARGESAKQADVDALAQIDGLPADAGNFANRAGLRLVLDCGDGGLAVRIAQKTKHTVFAIAGDEADCDRTRRALDAAGLYGTRATAVVGSLSSLPLPDGYGNLIVAADCRGELNLKEVSRALGPNGLAVVGGRDAVKEGYFLGDTLYAIDLAPAAWPPASHMYPAAGFLNGRLMV